MSRKPLIAGNWKMNLNHAEAVTLVQKLAWTLDDANFNFSATEVAVFPPFTDIRSVQTLVEGDQLDAAKVQAAYKHGLTPVLCVGEPLEVREAGTHVEYTLEQLRGSIAGLTAEQAETLVIAYEPVWAIGTGKVATADDAQEMSAAIRAEIAKLYSADVAEKVRVLYGGSVKSSSAPSIMGKEDVDGVLVGGASLQAEEFAAIARFDA